MTTMTRCRRLAFGAVLLGMAAAIPAQAESTRPGAPAPAAPVPSVPETTTASYGDWVLRCQRGGATEKPQRICEAAQSIQVQGQTQPIAQMAVGRANPGEPLQVTVVLPPNIAFPSSVRVQAEEKEPGAELPWRRCVPGACVASASAKDETVKLWRSASRQGRIVFRNSGNQEVAIPLSWRGLAQALDALAKE